MKRRRKNKRKELAREERKRKFQENMKKVGKWKEE